MKLANVGLFRQMQQDGDIITQVVGVHLCILKTVWEWRSFDLEHQVI